MFSTKNFVRQVWLKVLNQTSFVITAQPQPNPNPNKFGWMCSTRTFIRKCVVKSFQPGISSTPTPAPTPKSLVECVQPGLSYENVWLKFFNQEYCKTSVVKSSQPSEFCYHSSTPTPTPTSLVECVQPGISYKNVWLKVFHQALRKISVVGSFQLDEFRYHRLLVKCVQPGRSLARTPSHSIFETDKFT